MKPYIIYVVPIDIQIFLWYPKGKAGWKYAVSYANFSIVFVLFKSRVSSYQSVGLFIDNQKEKLWPTPNLDDTL